MLGVPPFSMLALPKGGMPTTSLLGTSAENLTWLVDQPIGAELLLTVIDGNGNPGGLPPAPFTVIAGQSSQCLPPPPNPDFTVTSNVTDVLNTCQPWGLRVTGGVPPYNVTLVALGSPVITNVTIGLGDDIFTYINRADPGTSLMAVVNDLQGRWATGSPVVQTQGSSNVDCIGLVSSTGNSAQVNQSASADGDQQKRRSIIIGVSVTFGVLVLIGLGIAGFILYRRRQVQRETEMGPDLTPRGFSPVTAPHSSGHVLSINTFIAPESPRSMSDYLSALPPSASHHVDHSPYPESSLGVHSVHHLSAARSMSTTSRSQSTRTRNRPSFASFPSTSVRRSNKAREAGYGRTDYPSLGSPSQRSPPMTAGSQSINAALAAGLTPIESADDELVFQHRDAGLPRELPPPYADRSGPSGPS